MRALSRWLLPLVLAVAAAPSWAQQRAPQPQLRCDTASVGGTIRGTIVNDSTHQPVTRRAVFLESTHCMAVSDSNGHFEIRSVPPGQHRISVGNLGYRRFRPLPVEVKADSVVEVVLRLRPENQVADCRDVERCAALLVPDSSFTAELSDAERLEETAWRTSIALAGKGWDSEWIPCADVPNERIGSVLEARFPTLVPSSECEVPQPQTARSRLIHRPSGSPARRVELYTVEQTPGGAMSKSSYYVGPLWAEGWTCRYRRQDGQWVAWWCGMDWIS